MELAVSGTGFAIGGTVTVTYDDAVAATAAPDNSGAFKAAFNVPTSKYGDHVITVKDRLNTRRLAFVVESEAPSIPVLLLPGNTSVARAATYLDWMDIDDPSQPVTYSLQVATDRDFIALAVEKEGLTESRYTLSKEEELGAVKKESPYYWRIKAIDSASNESEWSLPQSFYVMAPPVPRLLLPATGVKADDAVHFDWQDVTSLSPPITYRLQVAADKDFTSVIVEQKGMTKSEYTLDKEEKLPAVREEVPYYWRVKAIDGALNESGWSEAGSFYVGFTFALPSLAIYILIGIGALLIAIIAFWLGRRTAYYQTYE